MKVTPLTPEQAAVVSAYTGILIGNFSVMHKYAEELLGRPIYTSEMGSRGFDETLRDAAMADFLALNPVGAKENVA